MYDAEAEKWVNVQMDVLDRICRVLECDLADIMELLPPSDNE
jgi:DNA-binding Xre family transcriptional regulator